MKGGTILDNSTTFTIINDVAEDDKLAKVAGHERPRKSEEGAGSNLRPTAVLQWLKILKDTAAGPINGHSGGKEQLCGSRRALGTSRAGGSWARHGSGCI